MRRRELINRLKADRREFGRTYGVFFSNREAAHRQAERRLFLLHALEDLLPEIIEKLEAKS